MSDRMTAAMLYGKEDVRLEELPLPELRAGEVLLKVQAALTCGTDLKVFRNGTHAKMIRPPSLFGHEFSGIIEAVGPEVAHWKPGQRVVAANSAPCRDCFFCRKNQPNLCSDLLFVNGAYAEYLRIPARVVEANLLAIPSDLSFPTAALTEPLACVVRAVDMARPSSDETVVILGAGPVGLLFVQMVARTGASVIAVGRGRRRLRAASECGAEKVFDLASLSRPVDEIRRATPQEKGPDLVIEAVGRPEVWSQALLLARPGGRALLFGGCPEGSLVPLDTRRIHYDELTILSAFHHTPEAIRESLRLLSEGAVRPEPLITGKAPLKELPQILRRMLTESDGIKTAILP